MKKYLLLAATLLMSVASFAEWTKPAAPAAQAMEIGKECYLYNEEADGFLVGANDWGTRASVSQTLGHKVIIEEGTAKGSYYITNLVLSGWMENQWGYMFIEPNNIDYIYVDNTKEGKKDNQYTFVPNGNKYKIQLSEENGTWKLSDNKESFLGVHMPMTDTRIYLSDNTADATTWYFVSVADYESYTTGLAQYKSAIELGKVIEEAKTVEGVDATALSNAEKAYANSSSTPKELDAAKEALKLATNNAKYNQASPENPIEVLSIQGIATDFNDGNTTGWTSSTGAQNKQASNGNNAADYSVTGNHYENWHPDAFTPGKISAKATNLLTGVYQLEALAFTNKAGGTYLYAGENAKLVTASNIDIENPTSVFTVVTDGSVEIGLDIREKGPNWVGIDNVALKYYGNSEAAYKALTEETINAEPDYDALIDAEEAYCKKSVYEDYCAAKQALEEATNAEEAATALTAFNKASSEMAASVVAYTAYAEKVAEASAFINSTTAESDAILLLSDYLDDDTEAPGLYNGNGGAAYILSEGLLENAQITAELDYLDKLLKEAMANAMKDGDDCTKLLVNPNFTEEGGWTAAAGIDWPLGNDGFKVFQAWGRVCDVHQNLTALQNGIYEMNLQSIYKPDGDTETYQCYAYINDFDTKIGTDETLGSSESASSAFAEGKCPVKVYGLVTDGNMKIGIANRLRTGENGILYAGGVTLTFRAKNAEACAALLADLKEKAEAIKESHYGQAEASALAEAISNAEGVSGDEGYKALVALKKALDTANEGITLYSDLKLALANLKDAIDNNKADKMTVAKAQALYDEATAAYEDKSYNNEVATQAISDVKAITVSLKMGGEKASEDNPVDYTSVIVNNNFDPAKGSKDEKRIDGWKVEGALNGYKSYSCSFNKGTFLLSQELEGLPKGKYMVTVQTYYRAGSYEEEAENINAGKDTHLMKFFANTSDDNFVTSIMNLSEGSKGVTLPEGIGTREINGITVPDGTGASVKCYEAGLFLNKLTFTVAEDGKAVIGLRLDETIGSNDYTVVGPWKLYYMGDPTEGQTVEDYSDLIVNNNFDPAKGSKDEKRIDGWNVEGALNGYKSYSCSFNKGTFLLSQDLVGLPEGKYKVTVQTYYRAGSYEEEAENINAGKDTHLMKFFANTSIDNFVTSIMNLSEGSKGVTLPEGIGTREINGITVPDGTGASVKCYEAGLFLNELEFTVGADGKATIGLRLDETIGSNDYTVVGPWKLYYYGKQTPAEQDFSDLIVNNNFDPSKGSKDEKRIDGWNVEGALNGYKSYSCSFNKGTFKLTQDLEGLPKGKYMVTVQTYYRAGSYEEEAENINAGKDTHLMKFFANTSIDNYVTSIMNLSEGSKGVTLPEGIGTREINGITVPDGTGASVKCYEAGLFLNKLTFYVGDDGKATIGLRLDETIGSNDYTVVGPWKLYYYGEEKVNEEDYSDLIVNNNFDPSKGSKDEKRIDGWNVEGALNGYKSYSCSFNKGTFNLSQDLVGLPEGNYKVTVQTYYRAGSYEEEAENINAGKDTHLMKFYANTSVDNYVTSIMNLSEGSKGVTLPEGIGTREINGITVPDGTGASVKCYEAGLFLNELTFSVGKDGKATIGLRLDETIGSNDYTVVGPWKLYYYGEGTPVTGIGEVKEDAAPVLVELVPVAYYSLSGARLSAPQKGINIVKMSNGTSVKMIIK